MKRFPYLFTFAFLTITTPIVAQRAEVGFGIGTLNYSGDLVDSYNFAFSRPAITGFYRSNLSSVVSFRAGLLAGKLAGSDSHAKDAFGNTRNYSFNVSLIEASTIMEYHFINWRDAKHYVKFTPYAFAGMALFGISGHQNKPEEYSNVQVSIPFGIGAKYIINPRYYLGLEFGVRKTFFDYLDNVSEEPSGQKNYQYGNPLNTDVYYFLGISITRTFYDIPCPSNPYK